MEEVGHGSPMSFFQSLLDDFEHPKFLSVAVAVVVILVTTRLLTGKPKSAIGGGASTPAVVPYWLPFVGHAVNLATDRDGYLTRTLKSHPEGIFSLQLFGRTHHILASPAILAQLLNQTTSAVSGQWLTDRLMRTNFGVSGGDQKSVKTAEEELRGLMSAPGSAQSLDDLVARNISQLRISIADLVTFNTSPADQMEWEQIAEVDTMDDGQGGSLVEADLFQLTRNFVAYITTGATFGDDFVKNFPDFAKHLWQFDHHFVKLAMDIPSSLPYGPLRRARAARQKLLAYLDEFHAAFDKHSKGEDTDARWENFDAVSDLVKKRQALYREAELSIRARASLDLALLWALNTNSPSLIFWMVHEIFRDRVLLEQIRDEIQPYVSAVQPKNEFGLAVWVAPELETVDVDGLLSKCPLLKATYIEALRLYSSIHDIRRVEKDTRLSSGSDTGEIYLLKKGTYVHTPHAIQQLNPVEFPDAIEFQSARHLKEHVDGKGHTTKTAEMGTMRPYGKLLHCSNNFATPH